MVYMDTNESNTHADSLLGSRWAQRWVHVWAQTLVILLVYVTKGTHKDMVKKQKPENQRQKPPIIIIIIYFI